MLAFRKKRGISSKTELMANSVVKLFPIDHLDTIICVEGHARELGCKSGLFYVPQILNVNIISGRVEYELIEGFVHLAFLLDREPMSIDVLQRIARSLATIHADMEIPADRRVVFGQKSTDCCHGDFSALNIGLDSSQRVIVLDWAPAAANKKYFNYAPKEYDLALFLYSLFESSCSYGHAWRYFEYWTGTFFREYFMMDISKKERRLLLVGIDRWGWCTFRWLWSEGKILGGLVAPVLAGVVKWKVKRVLRNEFN